MVNDIHYIKFWVKQTFPILPFLILLDQKDQRIIVAGPSMIKCLKDDPTGKPFEQIFKLTRPRSWNQLPETKLHKYIIFFSSFTEDLEFKAQATRIGEQYILLAINPLLTGEHSIKEYALSLSDFPAFDTVAEFLFLRQSNRNSLKEAEELNSSLIKRNDQLLETQKKLYEVNQELEEKVKERTAEIQEALDTLHRAQYEIISKEKMSLLGQLVSGIAHEINTPLGSIKASTFNLKYTLDYISKEASFNLLPEERKKLRDLYFLGEKKEISPSDVFSKTSVLAEKIVFEHPEVSNAKKTAAKLIAAGIDDTQHPFAQYVFQSPNSTHLLELACEVNQLLTGLSTIELAADRASKVVHALKTYVHGDENTLSTYFNLRDQFESVLILFLNATRTGIEIENNLAPHLQISARVDQMAQVWTNIISNAIHAIQTNKQNGKIIISSDQTDTKINVHIANTGPKIPEQIMDLLFKPFFTTKERGIGTGLGLNIVEKIIESHGGVVTCTSNHTYTIFTVSLPLIPSQKNVY